MYLQGVVIDKELNIIRGLKTISGIGQKKAEEICNLCHIHHKLKISELDNQQERRVQTLVAKMRVGHLLKKETTSDIFNLINNKTYRGYKHLLGLPVKGQRTKTNAKTRKTHKNSLIKIGGREYFKKLTKQQYINNITTTITSTSHAHYKIIKPSKKKK